MSMLSNVCVRIKSFTAICECNMANTKTPSYSYTNKQYGSCVFSLFHKIISLCDI